VEVRFISRGKVSLDPGRIPHTKQLEKDGGDMDAGRREGVIRALVIKLFSSGLGLIRFGDTDRNVSVILKKIQYLRHCKDPAATNIRHRI